MSVGMTDWAVAIIFLVALILVRSFRTPIRSESIESYDNIAGGLIILGLTALARLYHGLGMFESVPFLSETIFFDLVHWIGVITGSVFIISGVANWLPLARYHRKYNQERIERLDILRKVEQLVAIETRLDTILSTTLQYMATPMSFYAGAVFKCSATRDTLVLAATTPEFPIDTRALENMSLSINNRELQRCSSRLTGYPTELGAAQVVLPIVVNRQIAGYYLFWDNAENGLDPDDRITLRLVADVVARKIETDRMALQKEAALGQQAWRTNLEMLISQAGTTRQKFSALVQGMAEQTELDFAALVLVDTGTNKMKRFSSGGNGQVLVENGLNIPVADSLTGPAFNSLQTINLDHLANTDQPDPNEIMTDGQVRSLLALPIAFGSNTNVILLAASQSPAAFGPKFQSRIGSLETLTTLAALPEVMIALAMPEIGRMEKLRQGNIVAMNGGSEIEMIERAAAMISGDLNADLVRVSVVDDTGSFLESKAVISTGPMTGMVPSNGQMILSLMPWHQHVLATGLPVMMDDSLIQTSLSDIEARQAFKPGVRSICLIPISLRGQAIGLISVASLSSDLLIAPSKGSQVFVHAVADQLAACFDRTSRAAASISRTAGTSRIATADGDLRDQVEASLTGIIGSVDLLRSHPSVVYDDRMNQYLSMIDRSARRIDTAVSKV